MNSSMKQQISPWSVYEKGFRIKSTTISQKAQASEINQKVVTEQDKKVQQMQAPENVLKQQVIQVEYKTQTKPVGYEQPLKSEQMVEDQSLAILNIEQQNAQVDKLIEESFVFKVIRHELTKAAQMLVLPQIKRKNGSKTKPIIGQSNLYTNSGRSLKLNRDQPREQKVQKLLLINYNPFDDSDIVKRGIQIQMKKKLANKRMESRVISKLLYS